MAVNFILGENGTGKTRKMLETITNTAENLVITTDPAVVYIEQTMAKNHIPGKCVGIFALAKYLAQEITSVSIKAMSKEEQIMLLGKINTKLQNKFFAFDQHSLSNTMLNEFIDFINECKEAKITTSELLKITEHVNNAFSDKIHDIVLMYHNINDYMEKNALTTNDGLLGIVNNALEKGAIRYKNIYIDTLDKYTPNVIDFIKKAMTIADNVTIAITTSKTTNSYLHQNMVIANDLISFAKDNHISYTVDTLSQKVAHTAIAAIKNSYFNSSLFAADDASDIVMHGAPSVEKEVEFIVSNIEKLRAEGKSYSDITIASDSIDEYISVLKSALHRARIPAYYYRTTKLDQTDLFDFTNTILKIVANGWTADLFTKVTQFAYLNVDESKKSSIIRFFLRFGDDINIAFTNGAKYDYSEFIIVNDVFTQVSKDIDNIKNSMGNTGAENIAAIMNYFKVINITETLAKQVEKLELKNEAVIAGEIKQHWISLMNLFQCIYNIYGQDTITIKDFCQIVDKCAGDIMVSSTKRFHNYVTIMSASDAKNQKNKVLFLMACNEGKFPKPVKANLMEDYERNEITAYTGKKLATTMDKQDEKMVNIYATLVIPSEKLYLTWALTDEKGVRQFPSTAITNIIASFPNSVVTVEEAISKNDNARFTAFLHMLSRYKFTGDKHPELDKLYLEFSTDKRFAKRFANAVTALTMEKNIINSSNVTSLYADSKFFAATRIEKFNACPFKHFMEYAMKPITTKLFDETAADKGTYYHEAAKAFFDYMIENNIAANAIAREEFDDIMSSIFDKIDETHNENILNTTSKYRYKASQMRRKASTSIWHALQQLANGSFKVKANELSVGRDVMSEITLKNGEKVNITGTIDRLDVSADDKYARIIDYKSGDVTFSEDRLRDGVQLQLPLYLKAMSEYSPAGMYYFHIQDAIGDADAVVPIEKKYQLSGPTIDNRPVCVAMDNTLSEPGSTSTTIQVAYTSKDELSKRSKTVTEDGMKELIETAEAVAVDSIERILKGETKAFPYYSKDINSCEYCKYRSVCHFDANKKGAVRTPSKADK